LLHSVGTLDHFGVNFAADLLVQHRIMKRLSDISRRVQFGKKSKPKVPVAELQHFVQSELMALNQELVGRSRSVAHFGSTDNTNHRKGCWMSFPLPLDAAQRVSFLDVVRCKFMSSAKAPLWLSFTALDRFGGVHGVDAMYKYGDDLRQDILALQLIAVMDALWMELDDGEDLDLKLRAYRVIPTGSCQGMIELVLGAQTTNDIHTKHGVIRGNFNERAHALYLQSNADGDDGRRRIEENYARSVAGYSVAAWVLGIADRHPSNIMIHGDGVMFHIDFGHFLGNFKEKQIGIGNGSLLSVKWNRERSPFIFTSMMKYAIDGGDDGSVLYKRFVRWLFSAYSALRRRRIHKLLLNLLLLMVPSLMPELIRQKDGQYLTDALRLDLRTEHQVAVHVEQTLNQCLADKYRSIDKVFHAKKHSHLSFN